LQKVSEILPAMHVEKAKAAEIVEKFTAIIDNYREMTF
jgi:hypothetical protein